MKQLLITPVFLLLSAFGISTCYAITADIPTASAQSSQERVLRGELIVRKQDGHIETNIGNYKLTGVEIVDHRKIDDWYKQPADAQVSLYFNGDRLVRVVIY